jgi:hypothetical protein
MASGKSDGFETDEVATGNYHFFCTVQVQVGIEGEIFRTKVS